MIVLNNGDKITGMSSVTESIDYTIHGVASTGILTQFATGKLGIIESDLYISTGIETVISTIILVNKTISNVIINLYFQPFSGDSYGIIPNNIELKPGYSLHWSGDKITVMATDGSLASSTSGTSGISGDGGTSGTSGVDGSDGSDGTSGGDYESDDITTNTTFYLSPTGSDSNSGILSSPWKSINKAFDYLQDKSIDGDVIVTIQLADGTYNLTETQVCNHLDGSRIKIKGENTIGKSMTHIVNTTGSILTPTTSNFIQARIRLTSNTGIDSGDYVLIKNAFEYTDVGATYKADAIDKRNSTYVKDYTSRGEPSELNGVFKVTNVHTSDEITISAIFLCESSPNNIDISVGACIADVTVIKSILSFTGVAGIHVSGHLLGSRTLNGINNVVLVKATPNYSTDSYWEAGAGIYATESAHIELGTNVGLSGWWIGLGAHTNASIYVDELVVTGCDRRGIEAGLGSTIYCMETYASGNNTGIGAINNGTVYAMNSVVTSSNNGFSAINGGMVKATFGVSKNCNYGVLSGSKGTTSATYMLIYSCYYGISASSDGWALVSARTGYHGLIKNCNIGLYAQQLGHISYTSTYITFTSNVTDLSPVVDTFGADGSYIG